MQEVTQQDGGSLHHIRQKIRKSHIPCICCVTKQARADNMDYAKRLPNAGVSVYPQFLLSCFVLVPVWLFFLLPLTLLYNIFAQFQNLVKGSASRKAPSAKEVKFAEKSVKKSYDVVIFGATGFTGRLAALYMAKNYAHLSWTIAGRRKDALLKIKAELVGINESLSSMEVIVADVNDVQSLAAMTRQTKVVITTAGPFDKYGTNLVHACVEQGVDYCDITGETDWTRQMVMHYDDSARRSGSRIVHFCGHDCIPWDLLVMECSKALKTKGDTLAEIRCYDDINASASGGTLATVFHTLENRVKLSNTLGYDPLLKLPDGSKSAYLSTAKNQMMLGYAEEIKSWVGPFVMAMVMGNCVRRSNALKGYSAKLTYREAMVCPNFFAGVVYMVQLLLLGTLLACPPLRVAVGGFFLPQPGEGPSEKSMDNGFLRIRAFGVGEKGGKVEGAITFPTDPGYRDTARMLVESGLCLALEPSLQKVGGGVYTPAACMGSVLTQRLVNTGSTLSVTVK